MKRTRRILVRGLIGIVVIGVAAAVVMQTGEPPALNRLLGGVGDWLKHTLAAGQPRTPGQRGGPGRFGAEGPVPVLVAAAVAADVPVYFDGVGTTKALNTVTVRPQIDGKLMRINFREGQDVEHGFVLAEIDPTTYQAQYDQAVAKKAQDEAQLANANIDLDRYNRLVATNAINRQQADTQKALVAQLDAQVKQDQAAIDNARAILDYTKIIAPIGGRTGIRQVDAGNIVHAADTTGIVVITEIRPISIFFTLPQQQIARVNKAFAQGPLAVEALGADNRTVTDRGTLQVVDNQIDQTTGTIKLKAEFPNPDLQLWPGQFINVRLLVDTLKQVVVVPTAAVQRGPNGTFVYVVREGDKAAVRTVTVSQQDDIQAVITAGVQASERVVTSGFARLSDGARVTVSSGAAQPAAPAEERRRRRDRDGNAQSEEPPRDRHRSERTEGTTTSASP